MHVICNILYQWTLNKPGFVAGGCFITARKPFNTVTFSGGPGWTRTSNVSNVTVLQTVEITSYSYWPKLFSGSGGIRTHLLINHYTNLSRGRFYGPLVLHSHYISNIFFVVPVGLEPTITQLKRLVLSHSATRPSLCSHPDSNRNPWIKSPVD